MPSTQHLVQKHQQFLSEVKSSEEKVKGEAPRARLRDSFILDGDETGTTVVPALSHAQGVSLKSIIQKHEDMATTGKNVRREVQSTKTVTSSHGTVTSDGKVSLSKHIIHGEMRGKDGAEPTGRITTSQYNYKSPDDPSQKPHVTSTTTTTHLGASQRNSITSLGEVRIEEHKENDSRRDSLVSSARKSLESRQKEESLKQSESERKTIVRGDSIKALQHKFQQPTGVNQVNQKPTYPKAGLILRSNSLTQSDDQNHLSSSMKRTSGEERRSSVEERRSSIKDEREESTRTTSKTSTTSVTSSSTRRDSGSNLTSKTTTREGSKSATSFLDDTSKVTGVQDILQRMRNADLVTENNDTTEDAEARSLLNKFLGASVILQGMEAGGAGPASSALVSQVERQRILTSTQRKTDDIDEITDEKQLQILLEACCDYEQRRKIRARLRKIMADRKGGQGELVGGEDREERREGELVGRWVEDSGTESGEERKGVEEAVEEVKGALERLTSALPRLAGNLGGSVSDLVAKLQNCLSTPAPPPRKNKRRHHTVGVTAEEIARARKWAERPRPLQITRGEFKALEHKAGFFIEPQPQTATISFNSRPLDTAPPINYDPSATLFTPAQSVQIAVHKAAIQKQISQEETNVRRVSLQRQMSQEDIRKKESDGESSSDEEISPARRLLKIASKRRTRISKIKRSNTVEIPRPATYCDSDTDDPAYSSDRSDLKRKSCGGLYAVPPPFLPKTDNDIKFLDFLNKVNDASSKVISYNPSARGGKHWSNRFSRIKTTFEDQSSADEKEKEVPKGKSSPFPQQKNFIQPKLPWSVKQEGDVVVGSLTVAKKVPGPVNQFTHAPMSAFKPVEKKVFPSSVSGSVKQLASQKFAPQAEPEIIKPVPSVPPRNHPKYQPVPGPDASPLSQRFVPNKVSGVQQHPPAHTYLNQFANYSPKHVHPPNDKTPLKTPNKIQEPKQEPVSNGAHYKQSHSVNKSSNFINSQPSNDFNHWKAYQESKPELPAKPVLNYNRSIEPPSKSVPISSNHNQSMQHPAKSVSNYTRSINQPAKPIPNYTQPIVPVPNPHQPLEHPVKSISNYSQPLDLPVKPVLNYSKSLDSTDNPDTNCSRHIGNPKPVPSYSKPILQTPDSVNQSNYSAYSIADHKVNRDSPKAMANYNVTSQEPSLSSQNVLITDYNSNWTGEGINNSKGGLSIPNQSRDSDSLSPHPYKGCYVYNENNEILSTSPYMPPSNVNIHVPVSPSYREPIYQNISEVHNSSSYLLPSDLPNNLLPPYQVNGLRTPDKIPLPHQFTESGTFYPSDQGYNNHSVIREPVQRQRNVTNSPKYDLPSYYPSQDPDAKKGSHDSLIEFTHRDDYSPEYAAKASPYVVYNNCPNGKRGSNECLNSFSPAFGNLSGTNSRGDSPRGSEEWDECVEEKAVVGRVMGEAQCQRAVTQSRRVESRFPNAPPSANLLRPPPEPAKIPSPILKTRQDHSMAPKNGSPKSLSPSFPNVLHKSESWHQMVKEQMTQAKQAPPLPAKVVKTKSSHTLALPKQFEGALHPEVAQRLQSTVSQYMSKSPSSQRPLIKAGSVPCGGEDIENVDEAFESLFREVSKKRNSK